MDLAKLADIWEVADKDELPSIKAEALSSVEIEDFNQDGYEVRFIQKPHLKGSVLELEIAASKDQKLININNPIQFVNPPVHVESDIYTEEIVDGELKKRYEGKLDPQQALKNIIIQVIRNSDK